MASSSPSSTTTAGASDAITALKLVHDGRVKRVAIADAKALTFEALTNLIRESFPDTLGSLAADASLPTVHYEDDEKDMVVVDSTQELAEAFRVTAANPTARVLRLTIESLPAAGAAEASTKTTEATTTTTTANEGGDADDEDDDDDDAMYGDDNDDSTDAAIAAALADSFQQAATPPAAPAAPAAATTDDAAQSFNNIASAFGIDPAVARSMLGPERAGMAEKFLNKAFQGQAAPTAATTPAASATPATGAGAGTPPPFMQHLMQAFAGGNNAGAGAGAGSGAGTAARPASLGSAIRQMLGSFGVDMPACADAEAEVHADDDEGNCSDDSKEGDKASAEGADDDDGAADGEAGVAVHRGISCDGCNAAPIRGIRYKSVTAFNFDVCEACEASGRYDDDHVFLKIRSPQHGRGVVQLIDRASARTPGSPFGIWGGGAAAQPAPPANPLAALFKAFGGAGGAGCHRRGGGGKRGGRCGKRGGSGCGGGRGGKGKTGGACGAPGEGHPFANLMSTLRQHFGANCGPQAGAASSSSSASREQDDIAAAIAASLGAAAPTTTSASSSSATPPATEAAIPTGVPVTTTNAEVPPPAGAGAGAGAAAAVMATATATATTTAPAASAPVTDEELVDKVDTLVAMGFSAATAMYALRTHGGDVSKALSSLVDDN